MKDLRYKLVSKINEKLYTNITVEINMPKKLVDLEREAAKKEALKKAKTNSKNQKSKSKTNVKKVIDKVMKMNEKKDEEKNLTYSANKTLSVIKEEDEILKVDIIVPNNVVNSTEKLTEATETREILNKVERKDAINKKVTHTHEVLTNIRNSTNKQ